MLLYDIVKDMKESKYLQTRDAEAFVESEHPREEDGKFAEVSGLSKKEERLTEYNRKGKDWFASGVNFHYDKVERLTDKIDDAAEDIFRGEGDKQKIFAKFFEELENFEMDLPNTFEAARQNRILTSLESKRYKTWSDVPDLLTVYRGDTSSNSKPGKYDSFSFDKNIAKGFAGKHGVVKKFTVHKNDIPWVNSGYVGINESELLLPSKVVSTSDSESNIDFQGLKIHIENPQGSIRKGEDSHGEQFEVKMFYPYGEILGTEGVDGDPIDCFVGPVNDAPFVFIVREKVDGKYDEDKCFLGFSDELHARNAFLAHYDDASHLGPIDKMTIEDFKKAIKSHKKGTRVGDADTNHKIFGYEWEKIKAVQQK
jgi:hypothetical protein